MAAKQMTWIGSGPIYFGDYDPVNGTPGMGYLVNIRPIGCMNSSLTTTPSTEEGEIKESCSGARSVAKVYDKSKSLGIKLSMRSFDRHMLASAFFSESVLVGAGTVTGEVLPTVVADDVIVLRHPGATSVVLTDSAATPVTLALDTHYKLLNAKHSTYQIMNVTGLTQPLKASYSYDAYGNMAALTKSRITKGLLFTGENDEGDIARIMIPQVSIKMSGEFDWLSEEPASLDLEGQALYSSALNLQSDFGGFMRIAGLPA